MVGEFTSGGNMEIEQNICVFKVFVFVETNTWHANMGGGKVLDRTVKKVSNLFLTLFPHFSLYLSVSHTHSCIDVCVYVCIIKKFASQPHGLKFRATVWHFKQMSFNETSDQPKFYQWNGNCEESYHMHVYECHKFTSTHAQAWPCG